MPSRHSQAGSTPIWLIFWLAGMAAIAYWCIVRHVPALQQQIQTSASEAVTQVGAPNVDVTTDGRTATLTGLVASEAKRASLLTAVEQADGVRLVNDQMNIVGAATADAQTDIVAASQDTPATQASEPAAAPAPAPEPVEKTPEVEDTAATEDVAPTDTAAENPSTDAEPVAEVEPPKPEEPAPTTQDSSVEESAVAADAQTSDSSTLSVTDSVEDKVQALIEQARTNQLPPNGSQAATVVESPSESIEVAELQTDVTVEATADTETTANTETTADTENILAASEPPALAMLVKGETLNLTGEFSDKDSLLPLIQTAMSTFDSNYVINNVQVNQETAQADWLSALTAFLPSMEPISDASIDILDSQISISGVASSQKTHDAVIDTALTAFPSLSLVERISISEEPEASPQPTVSVESTEQTEAQTQSATTDTQENQQADAVSTIEPNDTDSVVDTPVPSGAPSLSLREAFDALQTERILFQSGSDVLTAQSLRSIETMSELFARYPDTKIEIDGHTDSQGSSSKNLELSQLRANAVRDYLIQQGIDPTRLSAYGFGDGVPIADNATAAGRALNRRIEFNF